jgi:hypothetical protein
MARLMWGDGLGKVLISLTEVSQVNGVLIDFDFYF